MAHAKKQKSSFWLTFLKVILGIVITIVVLVLGLYLYLKYSLGIDIIDIRNKIKLINKSVVESEIISNSYTQEDAKNGFAIIFGEDSIYSENEDGFSFNKEAFSEASLDTQKEVCLTDTQFASCINVCLNNAINSTELLEDVSLSINLKQMIFSNLQNTEDNKIKVDVNSILKINLSSVKNEIGEYDNFIGNFLLGIIPSNIYISTNNLITINPEDNSYQITPINTIINNLTLEQSQEILELVEKVFSQNENKNIVNSITTEFLDSLLIGSDGNGLLKSFNGVESFTFKTIDNKVCIVLMPEQTI